MSRKNEQFSPLEEPHDDGYDGAEVRYPVTEGDVDFHALVEFGDRLKDEDYVAGLARHEPASKEPELPVSERHEPQVTWHGTPEDDEAERKSEEAFRRLYPDINFDE